MSFSASLTISHVVINMRRDPKRNRQTKCIFVVIEWVKIHWTLKAIEFLIPVSSRFRSQFS